MSKKSEPQTIETLIERCHDNWVNGNRKDVMNILGSLDPYTSALVSIYVWRRLPEDERPFFTNRLEDKTNMAFA